MNLVTGATGLLGSHIVEQLVCRSRPVRALVRPGSDTRWLRTQPVELVEGDVTDPPSLRSACRGVTCLYHAAAQVGDWGPWRQFVRVTVEGTPNMLPAARAAGAERFIHISSISVYGQVDGEGLVLDETAPLGRNVHRWSYYTRAKLAAEQLVWQAYHRDRLAVTVIRPSWLYGPRDRATIGRLIELIRRGRARLIGNGQNRLNLAYAGNVAEACIAAADTDAAIGQAYNCSNDGVLTQRQYLNAIAELLGVPPVTRTVPYRVAYAAAFALECLGHLLGSQRPPMITRYAVWLMGRRCFFETKKARQQLGWRPTVSYERGIPLTVRWFLRQRGELPADAS
ncbi:MAG: NAD-dependent epimerase/dehydratase family protein [Phycisphaerae bacterium]